MKNILCCALFFLMTSISFAQDAFEKGYYINSKGVKVEGYLQIINFENINATEKLYFKKELKDEVVKVSTTELVEFGVGEELKFQKITFGLDDVSFHKNFNNEKELNLKTVTLFLNVLIEGEATLYSYDGGNDYKYFYSVKSAGALVSQLPYKKYMDGETIKENNDFREKLFKEVKCENQTFNEFVNLKYERKELLSIFEKYNKCKNSQHKVYKNKFEKKMKLNLIAVAGVNRFNSESTGFGFGGEVEVVVPSEKVSFFGRLQFDSMKASFQMTYYTANNANFHEDSYEADYKAFDMLLGIRYYIKVSKQHKFFANAAGGINNPKVKGKLKQRITNGTGVFDQERKTSYGEVGFFPNIGIGYLYKNKFGIDLDFDIQKALIKAAGEFDAAKYNKIGINLRYIFN